jgi:hypothetical protein
MIITKMPVKIVKSGSSYLPSEHSITTVGSVESLGCYRSLKEAIEEPLKNPNLVPIVREALEAIQKKAVELGWCEEALSAEFSVEGSDEKA